MAAYAEFTAGPDDGYVAHLRDAARRDREAELWVAELDGDGSSAPSRSRPRARPWREIGRGRRGRVPDARGLPRRPGGRGSARRWPSWSSTASASSAARAIVLSSLAEMTSAHRIYERLGFRRVPDRDWSPMPGVDLIAFRMELLTWRPTADLHRHRRRHRRRGRLRQPAGARHAPAARLVRGRDLRRDRPHAARGLDQRRHPGRAGAPGRQRGRPGGRGDRLLVVRRRAAAPLHGRGPPRRRATARSSRTGEITRVVVDAERFLSPVS